MPVERPCCRLPVMRCPTRRKRASFLTSMWIRSPGLWRSSRRTGGYCFAEAQAQGLQISQPAQAQAVQGPGHGGEGSGQQPGDVTQVQPLMAQLNSALEAVRIERPPLGGANTVPVHQSGHAT